jgi:hypothetical protein
MCCNIGQDGHALTDKVSGCIDLYKESPSTQRTASKVYLVQATLSHANVLETRTGG